MYYKLNKEDLAYLKNYDASKFFRPSVAADIVIFSVFDEMNDNYRKLPEKTLKVLLVKRGQCPFKEQYALPGGFVKETETAEQAAQRELEEETGVACTFLEQLKTTSTVERDPRTRVISVSYMALLNAAEYKVRAGDDAAEAEWFTVSLKEEADSIWNLILTRKNTILTAKIIQKQERWSPVLKLHLMENHGMAFDHAEIIAIAVFQLRKWVRESGIAFRLLPERFTLKQLQQIYEVILDRSILTPAFRKKMNEFVEETEEKTKDEGHRPAVLYRER